MLLAVFCQVRSGEKLFINYRAAALLFSRALNLGGQNVLSCHPRRKNRSLLLDLGRIPLTATAGPVPNNDFPDLLQTLCLCTS